MFYVGVAYSLSSEPNTVVCSSNYGYGVSTICDGSLDDMSASFIWDLNVVAHELGVSLIALPIKCSAEQNFLIHPICVYLAQLRV